MTTPAISGGNTGVVFKVYSVSDDNKPNRTWREIAEEASREQDSEKLQRLAEELERALDERRRKLYPARNGGK